MKWFKTRYVKLLERELERLQRENEALRQTQQRLIERLTGADERPEIRLTHPPTPQGIDEMIRGMDIFEDIEECRDTTIVDNRKAYDDDN